MGTVSGELEGIVAVSAGKYHVLALDKDGYVWAWGSNTCGQVGDGTTTECYEAIRVVEGDQSSASDWLEDIVQVAAGRTGLYSLACDESGDAWAWGSNKCSEDNYGQLGIGEPTPPYYKSEPVQVKDEAGTGYLADVVDVDAGVDHSIGLEKLAEGGHVWCWGNNEVGQLGNDSTDDSDLPVLVVGENSGYLTGIVDVAVSCGGGQAGSSFALGEFVESHQTKKGCVWAWGENYSGQLGQGSSDNDAHPRPLKVQQDGGDDLEDIVAVSAGKYHVLALDKDGYVWAWGYNKYGQIGQGSTQDWYEQAVKVKIDENTFLSDIVYIDAGFQYSMAIDRYGNIWVWGRNQYGQLGLGDDPDQTEPYAVKMD